MNRRSLFSAAVASVMLPGAVVASNVRGPDIHPDAALIAMAERFIVDEQAIRDWPSGADGNLPEEFYDAVVAQDALSSQMGVLRATTVEGVAARARCLAAHNLEYDFAMDDADTATGRLVHYLMRDAAALSAGPLSAGRTMPDADLLKTCAAFDALEREYLATGFGHEIGSLAEAVAETEQERISEAQRVLVARMCDLQAVTREGMAARAHSLALWDAELMKDGPGDIGECLTAAIVRDLLAGRPVA